MLPCTAVLHTVHSAIHLSLSLLPLIAIGFVCTQRYAMLAVSACADNSSRHVLLHLLLRRHILHTLCIYCAMKSFFSSLLQVKPNQQQQQQQSSAAASGAAGWPAAAGQPAAA